jgi:hypothetical protein
VRRALNEALVDVGSLEKKTKLTLSQDNVATVVRVHTSEKTILQALADQYETRTVVVQTLTATTAFVEEYKQVARERILLQHVFDALKEAVVTGPHVRGLFTEENLSATVKSNHADFLRKSIK